MYTISCPEGMERDGRDDVRTCTSGRSAVGVWSGTAPICAAQTVYLSHGNTHYYANNTAIIISSIMTTDDTSLTCQTDSITCCRGVDNYPSSSMGNGEWLFPNGTHIARNRVTGSRFYWSRYHQVVRLYRQGDTQTPLGTYCCRIPDSDGVMRTFCANLKNIFYNNIRCLSDSVMAPTNGIVSYSSLSENNSYVFGMVATFSCSPGFSLYGPSTRTCETEQGTFSGTTPSCITITCSTGPNDVANGVIVYSSDTTPYDYGTTAMYECDPGYELTSGPSKRICTGDGNSSVGYWSGSIAVCSDIDECSGTAHGCDHTNSPGSYTCDCNSGYRLIAADGRGFWGHNKSMWSIDSSLSQSSTH